VPAGAALANAYGHEVGIAEYVIGAMLALTRSFGRIDASLRRGIWESQWAVGVAAPPPWPEMAGKTLGILGYGRIGQALARRARAFDMAVCAIRRDVARSEADGLSLLGGKEMLDPVLRRADYLAVTLSLNEETKGLIGARELGLMKPTAMLVNVARARDPRRGRALSGALRQAHRSSRARRLVSISKERRADFSGSAALSRAAQRDDDAARVRLDRRHARGAGDADRREHRPDRARRAAAEPDPLSRRTRLALPFFYGWIIVAAGFVTMAIGVNARTAFSLLFPPILDEFGWDRGVTAGAFSFGFLVSAFLSPLVGRLMDRAARAS
jgi:hypothetical protein